WLSGSRYCASGANRRPARGRGRRTRGRGRASGQAASRALRRDCRSCGFRVSSACSAANAAASWLRDTRVEMSRDTLDVAKRVVDAYNRRDVDGLFAELATPDFEWYPGIVRALDGGGYRGREGIARFAVDTEETWAELQIIPEEFRDLGDRVLVLGRIKGRGRGSGTPVDAPQAIILDFRGDRIWRS